MMQVNKHPEASSESLLFSSMLPQDYIKNPKGFHTVLIFLTTNHICNGLHRDLGSKAEFNFEGFRLERAPYSLPVTFIRTCTSLRTSITIIPSEKRYKCYEHK